MKTAILGLHAETSIHAGAGSALDVIDLPIQREAHTGWPCIFGSAMKGALRAASVQAGNKEKAELVFGPANATNEAYAGALVVGDARLLLLPVRSMTTHFKWVTCPAVLQRLQRDAERLGYVLGLPKVDEPAEMQAWAKDDGELFLEEYKFAAQKSGALDAVVSALSRLSAVEDFKASLAKQLVIVRDDDFAHLAKHAVPVTPHIALDSESKSVKPGALWFEETLPAETLLYVCLAANDARKKEAQLSAEQVLQSVTDLFSGKPYLQVGGNETVGMGWCKVKVEVGA